MTKIETHHRVAVDLAWQRVEQWIASNAPVALSTLADGCTDGRLEELEAELGVALPAGLRASLRRHDGESVDDGGLLDGLGLLGCDDIAYEWRGWTDLADDGVFREHGGPTEAGPALKDDLWWRRGWIPFAGNDGTNLCVDLDPAPAGRFGQVFVMDHELGAGPPVAPDVATWLALWADDLEAGAFEVEGRGLVLRDGVRSRAIP